MVDHLAGLLRQASETELRQLIYLVQGRVGPAYEPIEFGVGEATVVEAIALAFNLPTSDVKARYREIGDLGDFAAEIADESRAGASVAEVYESLLAIARSSGQGSTGRKTGLLAGLLRRQEPVARRYVVRIVLGRLRLGVGDPTVMEALSLAFAGDGSLRKPIERAYNVRADLGEVANFARDGKAALLRLGVQAGTPVRPALCERVTSAQEAVDRLGRLAAEPKFDGFRVQIHGYDKQVRVFSRNLEDLTGMFPEVAKAARGNLRCKAAILEGEALVVDRETGDYLPFQTTVQRRRKRDIEAAAESLPLKVFAFDVLFADGDLTESPLVERRRALERLLAPNDVITIAEQIVSDDPVRLEQFFDEKIQQGLEGIVCKRLDSQYSAGARNFNWVKLKRAYRGELSDTIDGVILGYWQGHGNRAQLGIGSLLIGVYDGPSDSFRTVSRLGSGFSQEEWPRLRGLLDEIRSSHRPARVESSLTPDVWCEPAYVVTVKADEITRSPMHTAGLGAGPGAPVGYALRFPRAVGFLRTDKSAEEATTVAEIIAMHQKQGRSAVEAVGDQQA